MIAEVLSWTVGVMGAGAGVWALVLHRKNGNGKHDPWQHAERLAKEFGPVQQQAPAPVQVQWPPGLEASMNRVAERLEHPLVQVQQPAWQEIVGELERITKRVLVATRETTPEWAKGLRQDLAQLNDRVSEPATALLPPELTVGLERVIEELNALDFEPIVSRLEELVESMPEPDQRPELEAELVRQLAELPQRVGRSVSDAIAERRPPAKNAAPEKKNNPPDPPKAAPRNLPPLNPQAQPNVPSIPAPYVPGTVEVPAGQVWSLLYLIQQQLSPNCPGTSASFAISVSSGTVYVGGASPIGGALSEENYAYELNAGDPPVRYQSSYPGGNTPVGELQVLAKGNAQLHVEVQS